jgi:hypothetical protein
VRDDAHDARMNSSVNLSHDDLIRVIRKAAKRQGMRFELVRDQGNHEVWDLDGLRVAIPRHKMIGPKMGFTIMAELEPKLGKRWWR